MKNRFAQELIDMFLARSIWIAAILSVCLAVALPFTISWYHAHQYEVESAELLTSFIKRELASKYPEDLLRDRVKHTEIANKINVFMEFGNLVEFKIWEDSSTLLYAFRDTTHIGTRFPENRRLQETLRSGETTVEIEVSRDSENQMLRPYGRLVEMYAPIVIDGKVVGAVEVYRVAPKFKLLTSHIIMVVSAAVVSFALLYILLYGQFKRAANELITYDEKLNNSYRSLGLTYFNTIRSLIKALELRDMETEGHSERVVALAVFLAEKLRMPTTELDKLVIGAYLHDIGKIGIPDDILLKPASLTPAEREIIKTHVKNGTNIIHDIAFLEPAREVILYHHERWDGHGYQQGLAGDEIPLSARIFALIDVFDALISDRPYRQALSFAQAREIIAEERGKHFDPYITDIFLAIDEAEFHDIQNRFIAHGIRTIVTTTVDHMLDVYRRSPLTRPG